MEQATEKAKTQEKAKRSHPFIVGNFSDCCLFDVSSQASFIMPGDPKSQSHLTGLAS